MAEEINLRIAVDETEATASFENIANNLQQIEQNASSTGNSINNAFNSQKVTRYSNATDRAAVSNVRLDGATKRVTRSQSRSVRATNAASGALLRYVGVNNKAVSGTRAFSGALAATPLGAALAGVTALYTAYEVFTSFVGDSTEEVKLNGKELAKLKEEIEDLNTSLREGAEAGILLDIEKRLIAGELTEEAARAESMRAMGFKIGRLRAEQEAAILRERKVNNELITVGINLSAQSVKLQKKQKKLKVEINALARQQAQLEIDILKIRKDGEEKAKKASQKREEKEKKASQKRRKRLQKEREATQKLAQQIADFEKKILEAEIAARLEIITDSQAKEVEIREDATRKQKEAVAELFNSQREAIQALELDKAEESKRLVALKEREAKLIEQIERDSKQDIANINKKFEDKVKQKLNDSIAKTQEKLLQSKLTRIDIDRELFEQKLINERNQFLAVERSQTEIEEFEKKQQAKRLENEKQFQIEILQAQLDAGENQTEQARELLQQRINTLQAEIDATVANATEGDSKKGGLLSRLLGVDEASLQNIQQQVQQAGQQALSALQRQQQERLQLAQKAESRANGEIDRLQRRIDTELKLVEGGKSANIELLRKELADQEKLRQQAIEQQRKAAQAQFAIDTAIQATNLVTSSSEIFKNLSPTFPAGLPLAIGSVAALFGAFVASRAQAAKAVQAIGFADGGVIPMGRDDRRNTTDGYRIGGTNMFVGGGEYIMPVEPTKKHRALLDAMRNGDLDMIETNNALASQATDNNTKAIQKAKEERQRLYKEAVKEAITEQTSSLGNKLDTLIKKANATPLANGGIMEYYYNQHGDIIEKRHIPAKNIQ